MNIISKNLANHPVGKIPPVVPLEAPVSPLSEFPASIADEDCAEVLRDCDPCILLSAMACLDKTLCKVESTVRALSKNNCLQIYYLN